MRITTTYYYLPQRAITPPIVRQVEGWTKTLFWSKPHFHFSTYGTSFWLNIPPPLSMSMFGTSSN